MIKQDEKYNVFVNELKKKIDNRNKKIVFLCIGTNKVTGDSFGPLVGTKLQKLLRYNKKISILGNIDKPINALNIEDKLLYVNKKYTDKYVIVVDSAVSEIELIGEIFVTKNKMVLGKGINRKISEIGDISIKCSVCKDEYSGIENFKSLKNVPKEFIKNLADIVSIGIYEVISNM
jgi:putative sporulation protein YyaC